MMDIKEAIKKVTSLKNLSEDETREVFTLIMNGEAQPAQIAALLVGLRMKGETVDEITGAARVMREKSVKISVKSGGEAVLDTCGTGGTGKGTFNISTTVALVAAGCGVKVAKHGNRAASSKCGSADVLEELGVKIDVPASVTERCVNEIGVGFLFAPLYHSAMKYAAPVRMEIGIRTIFNILGPLSSPASVNCQVIGVFSDDLTEKMAEVLGNLGLKRAFVVHGENKFDEVTLTGRTKVSELDKGQVKTYFVIPETFGMKKIEGLFIGGGTAKENAGMIRSILKGEEGPPTDVVLMNASLALIAAGKAKDPKEGVELARGSIKSGKAMEKLDQLIRLTNEK